MRYVLDNTSIKLDFADSFSLNCEGCLEDFQFASMRTLLDVNHKLYSSNRFILPSQNAKSRQISGQFTKIDNESIESTVNLDKIKFLMIGELLELRIETTWFQKNYIWEPHLFALTNIGIIKFQRNDITSQPKFMSLQSMNVELLPCDNQNPTEMIFRVCYKTFP